VDRQEDREWSMKMALLSADPATYGPLIFPAKKEDEVFEEIKPGDITSAGFNPYVKIKYSRLPTSKEVEEALAEFPQELVMGVEDFVPGR